MTSPITHAAERKPRHPHWIVTNNYRLRFASLGMSFIAIALHLSWQASPAAWAGLALIFLLYPHLAYWRACRKTDSQRAEYDNLKMDAALIGLVLAALHFPLWLSITLWLGSSMNSCICRGARGLALANAALFGGAVTGALLFGLDFVADTNWPSTVLTIVGLSGYLLAVALTTHWHNQQLRTTRHRLRLGEQALHDTNERLQHQLAEVTRLQAQLNEQAIRDPLTGLFNRRYLETIVPHELARCARDGSAMTLMMIDIDHFKSVNDRYGHQGGDEVLKALAGLLIDSVRASDVACRFGGEEFLLLLPNMAATSAAERAEQWRTAFAALTVRSNGAVIRATLSIGVAVHPRDGADLHALVRSADLALYQAKADGRDRVVFADAALVA